MNWKLIFNPFSKFTETQLLVFGIAATALGSLLGLIFQVRFDGILDVHLSEVSYFQSLGENLINIVVVLVLFFIVAKIVNKKTRVIDILNTAMVSRVAIYLIVFFVHSPSMQRITKQVLENQNHLQEIAFNYFDLAVVWAISMIILLFLTYFIVLLINGFRTATNIKKWQHFVWVAISIIIAEIVSKLIIYHLIAQ